jgi:hypothetical protein
MSELKVNKISPRSGTDVTLGDSGDTFTLGSGANIAGLTLSDNILFDTASKGIYLGVTTPTASNLLDDYEEGTWTPVYEGSTTDPVVTYASFSYGTYTKIGNMVHIQCQIAIASLTSVGSGDMRIGGLPFAVKPNTGSGTNNSTASVGSNNDWGTNNHPSHALISSGIQAISLFKFPPDPQDELVTVTASGMLSGGNDNGISLSGCYITDA